MKETSITYKKMKKSKQTKSNEQFKILRMISRDFELERNDGKFVSVTRHFKNKKKYNRNDKKRELRKDLGSLYCFIAKYLYISVSMTP